MYFKHLCYKIVKVYKCLQYNNQNLIAHVVLKQSNNFLVETEQ